MEPLVIRQPGTPGHGDIVNVYGETDFAWKVFKTKYRPTWIVPGQTPTKGTVTIDFNSRPTAPGPRFRTPYPFMIVPMDPAAPAKQVGRNYAVCILAAKAEETADSMVWYPEVCQVADVDEAYAVIDAMDMVAIGHRDIDSHSVGFWKVVAYRHMGVRAAEEAEAAGVADVDDVAEASMVENIQRGIGALRLPAILAQAQAALENVMGNISTLRQAPLPLPPPAPLPATMMEVDGVQAAQLLAAGFNIGLASGVAAAGTTSGAGLVRMHPPSQGSLNIAIARWVNEHRSPGVLAGSTLYVAESDTLRQRAQAAGSVTYASLITYAHQLDCQKFINEARNDQAISGVMSVTFGAQAAQLGPVPAGMQTRAQAQAPLPPPPAAPLHPLSDYRASQYYLDNMADPLDTYTTAEYYEYFTNPIMTPPSTPHLPTLVGLPFTIRGRPVERGAPPALATKGVVKATPYAESFPPGGAGLHLPQQPDLDTTTFVGSLVEMFEG